MKNLVAKKKLELKNIVVLTINVSAIAEVKNKDQDTPNAVSWLELRGQWEGLNLIQVKFYNKHHWTKISKLVKGDIIIVTGKLYNFFSSKNNRTFASIIVDKYKKVAKK